MVRKHQWVGDDGRLPSGLLLLLEERRAFTEQQWCAGETHATARFPPFIFCGRKLSSQLAEGTRGCGPLPQVRQVGGSTEPRSLKRSLWRAHTQPSPQGLGLSLPQAPS